jgi:aminotransferase
LPGNNSKERAMYLLRETGVACVPGEAFYLIKSGENLGAFLLRKRMML